MLDEPWIQRLGLLVAGASAVLVLAWLMAALRGLFVAWSAGEIETGRAWWRLGQALGVALCALLWIQAMWRWGR